MATSQKKQSINCKVLVLGKSGVGKSYILLQYTAPAQEIVQMPKTTIGVDYKNGVEKVEDTEVKMQIWDTAGQEKYRPIIQTYFKNSKAAVLVFDLTDKQSLIDVRYWLREVKLQCGKNVAKILVGNKSDLEHEEPDQALIQEYKDEFDMDYIETSALQKINIQEIFVKLAKKIYEQNKANNSQIQPRSNTTNNSTITGQPTNTETNVNLKSDKGKKKKDGDGCC